ncbi:hypothetical protein NFI96_022161 [Prochilodus magdalenae]|nr:hypothetical protein NFI96_022161 [Prochilodus magdalenae]
MRVRPGDDVVLHSDCVWRHGFDTVWFRNSSHEHMVLLRGAHPRYSTMSNDFHQTSDLLVRNVSESDLGLYFCTLQKKRSFGDGARACSWEDVCYYGNRTTRLSFHSKDPHSESQYAPIAVSYSGWLSLTVDMTPQTPSTPPVSDCSVCWKLLVSVCPVCVLLSSVVSSTCVYWIYRSRTKVTVDQRDDVGERERPRSRNRDKIRSWISSSTLTRPETPIYTAQSRCEISQYRQPVNSGLRRSELQGLIVGFLF